MKKLLLSWLILGFATIGLGGDGTLPFGMSGKVDGQIEMSYSLETSESFNSMAQPVAYRDVQNLSSRCASGYEFTELGGHINVAGSRYKIYGACHNGDTKELLAKKGLEEVRLRGILSGMAPRRTFRGSIQGFRNARRFMLTE